MRVDCPKCGSESAWYARDRQDVVLRCMCGYLRVVQTTLKSIIIEHKTSVLDIKLPRRESNLWTTLVVLVGLQSATSAEVTRRLWDLGKDYTVSDVASYLTILRNKSLVRNTEIRRGVAGGSTWVCTDKCLELVGV